MELLPKSQKNNWGGKRENQGGRPFKHGEKRRVIQIGIPESLFNTIAQKARDKQQTVTDFVSDLLKSSWRLKK